jgi:uncharacterized membrane protein
MDWFQMFTLIMSDVVKFMQSSRFWHNITLWDVFISTFALIVGVSLFNMFYGNKSGGDK